MTAFVCPYCSITSDLVYCKVTEFHIGGDKGGYLYWQNCPKCGGFMIHFKSGRVIAGMVPTRTAFHEISSVPEDALLLYAKFPKPPRLSKFIPQEYAKDYTEAYNLLNVSPKASAALSRRCLQRLLREKTGAKHGDLSYEIEQIIKSLPQGLRENVDAIRHYGNFAAHPNMNTVTGEIVDVEPGEAEWALEILLSLLEHYIAKPAEHTEKRRQLNAKLRDQDKPHMKS